MMIEKFNQLKDNNDLFNAIGTKIHHTRDDNNDSNIEVVMANDGDMYLSLSREVNPAKISFRASASGGRNPKTRKAIARLALAIKQDNEDKEK